MSDFLKKLNVLIKASVNDLLDGESERVKPDRLGPNLEREVQTLRQRVNDALDYEDELLARVQARRDEVNRLDREADAAVEQGHDADARAAIEAMQRAQQHLALAEADLRDHRLVTQELIVRVNELEAAVADAQHAQGTQAVEPVARIGQVLQEMRARISEFGDLLSESPEVSAPSEPDAQPEEQAIDDDLAQRLERLSKK
jgi:phage shock protein A